MLVVPIDSRVRKWPRLANRVAWGLARARRWYTALLDAEGDASTGIARILDRSALESFVPLMVLPFAIAGSGPKCRSGAIWARCG